MTTQENKTLSPENYLLQVELNDMYGFLNKSESEYDTHRPLLLLALNLSTGPVTEMGSGEGSTPYLRKYCTEHNRPFESFDFNQQWATKMDSVYIKDWNLDDRWEKQCGLLFIDQAPGEHRWKAIAKMANRADIIVFHDSEIGGAGDYQYDRIYPLFKYQLHYNRHGGGAGASMVSNKFDVSVYKGLKLGNFQFDNE